MTFKELQNKYSPLIDVPEEVNEETVISVFDDKLTLLEWLKSIETEIKEFKEEGYLINAEITSTITDLAETIILKIINNDEDETDLPIITLVNDAEYDDNFRSVPSWQLVKNSFDKLNINISFAGYKSRTDTTTPVCFNATFDVNIGNHIPAFETLISALDSAGNEDWDVVTQALVNFIHAVYDNPTNPVTIDINGAGTVESSTYAYGGILNLLTLTAPTNEKSISFSMLNNGKGSNFTTTSRIFSNTNTNAHTTYREFMKIRLSNAYTTYMYAVKFMP